MTRSNEKYHRLESTFCHTAVHYLNHGASDAAVRVTIHDHLHSDTRLPPFAGCFCVAVVCDMFAASTMNTFAIEIRVAASVAGVRHFLCKFFYIVHCFNKFGAKLLLFADIYKYVCAFCFQMLYFVPFCYNALPLFFNKRKRILIYSSRSYIRCISACL